MADYPVLLDLTGRRVVVVGLGRVGRRKAAGLVEAEARVVGIDPARARAAKEIAVPPDVEVIAEPYRADHLEGAVLVFAAATPEVNRQVVADARHRGLLVNSASAPSTGDFRVPAIWRDGPVMLTVSTTGAGPSLATVLRDRAAAAIGQNAVGLAQLLAELRPEVLARVTNPDARRRLLIAWSDPIWLDRWATEGPDAVRRDLMRLLEIETASM